MEEEKNKTYKSGLQEAQETSENQFQKQNQQPIRKEQSYKPSQEEPLIKLSTKQWLELLYNKNYKLLLLIPLMLLILSLAYLGYLYKQTGDFINKDITLTGGTSITILSEEQININDLKSKLSEKIDDFGIRELTDFRTGKQKAVIIESKLSSEELKLIIEEALNLKLTSENSSTESTGSSLGESFYNQLRLAIAVSFILMAIVVFFIFRTFVPSIAVVISAFADIIMTLAFINFLGVKVSSAGITAILMLVGYSVDTDLMLTIRLLKRDDENINKKLLGAFKTGITMTLTSIMAVLVSYFIVHSLSNVLGQIFLVLIVGLSFDILNTWVTNASILKWYLEKKK